MPAKPVAMGELRLGGLAAQERRNVQISLGTYPRGLRGRFL